MSNWNDIPTEMKEMIAQRCTEKTRISLKSTSYYNKQLVENTYLRRIRYLRIVQTEDSFKIAVKDSSPTGLYNENKSEQLYGTAEEFITALKDILKAADCIKMLKITNVRCDLPLERWNKDGYLQRLKVERLKITVAAGTDPKKIFAQIEPVYLSDVTIDSDAGNFAIYDMPQIVLAEIVHFGESIREEQLLNLNAREIGSIHNLQFEITRFVLKFLTAEHPKLLSFSFYGQCVKDFKNNYMFYINEKRLDLPNQLKVCLHYDMARERRSPHPCKLIGRILYASNRVASEFFYPDRSVLRIIKSLSIHYDDAKDCWEIEVHRKYHDFYCHKSIVSIRHVERYFDEMMEHFDGIETLTINLFEQEHTWNHENKEDRKINWTPRPKKFLVKELDVHGKHSITSIYDLLNQIEPDFMEVLIIGSDEQDANIFEMPHIYNVSKLQIDCSLMKPEHLLKLKAIQLQNLAANGQRSNCALITTEAINQYINNCLFDLDEKCYVVNLGLLNSTVKRKDVMDGFYKLVTVLNSRPRCRKVYIDSIHKEYCLEVRFTEGSISIYRTEKPPLLSFIATLPTLRF